MRHKIMQGFIKNNWNWKWRTVGLENICEECSNSFLEDVRPGEPGDWKKCRLWFISWWRHQMGTFSALLALYAGNLLVPGQFSAQRSVTRGFDIFFDPCLNKQLSKQSWGWWFETLSCPLWRHCNVYLGQLDICCDDMDLSTFLGNFCTLIGEEDSVSSAGHINSPNTNFVNARIG